MEDIGGYWRILEDIGGYWRILEDIGGYWSILEGVGVYWRSFEIFENIGRNVKISDMYKIPVETSFCLK